MTEVAAPRAGRVGCSLAFDVTAEAEVVLQIAVAGSAAGGVDPDDERLEAVAAGWPLPAEEVRDPDGNRLHVLRAKPGRLDIRYEATLALPAGARSGPAAPVRDADRLVALRPSRYCPSDRLRGYAAIRYGDIPEPVDRVRAICADVFEKLTYTADTSDAQTDAVDTLLAGRGVCRDYAHLVAALCRAVDVPARVVSVYAPGLSPMDFHAVVETALDGRWQVWDATRLAPRPTLIRIGTGRDAADTAFATVLGGAAELVELAITAVAVGDLPVDDHAGPATLGSVQG